MYNMIILNGANIDGNLRLSDQTPNRLVIVNASLDVVSGNGVIASDNLRASVMGTTGSGSLVFANSPVFGGTVQMAGFQLGTSATPGHVLTANASGVGTYQAVAALPAGTSGQTLRHDGAGWVVAGNLINDGVRVRIPHGLFAMAGEGFADTGMVGTLYDRNELTNAAFRGNTTVTVTGAGTFNNHQSHRNALTDATGSVFTINALEPTSVVVLRFELPNLVNNFFHGWWQPFFQTRLAFNPSFTYPNRIIVEVSHDGITWVRPSGGQWDNTNFISNNINGLWMGGEGSPNSPIGLPDLQWRFARFTLSDFYIGTNNWLWIAEVGVRHINAPGARQFLQAVGDNTIYGSLTTTGGIDIAGQIRIRGGSPAAGRFLGGDVNGVGTWQLVDINASTTGTLTAIRGGTGIALYTANNYIRAFNATTLEQRTPAQVLGDIGAAAAIHTHGNITTAGAIGITANLPIITGAGGALQVGSFGVAANTFCQGNDARLSNQRMPLAHSFLDTGLHFVSGLTVGHVLKATGNDTFTFAALVDTDIPNLHPNKIIQNVSNRFVGDSQIANWNTAHSWGNHAGLYSSILHTHGHISNIGAITSTPVIPASGDCLLLTDATDGNSIRRSVPLGTGTNTFLRNDGAWAVPGGSGAAGSSDLVYSQAVNTDVPINSTTPQAVLSAPLENIAAGDIIEVEINGNILNNSGAVRTFIHSFRLGATTFDYTDGTTIAASASALATHNIRFRFAVIATNNIFFDGYVSRGEPNVAGTRQAIAATTVGHIFNTSANNETGNKNVVYLCRGQNATATQTFQLRSFKVSVIKAKVMAVIPVTPTGLLVMEDNILRAFAIWNAVNNATSYPIQFRVNGGAATDAVAFITGWESDALTAGNLVEVRVAARNAAGTSTYSAWVGVVLTGM